MKKERTCLNGFDGSFVIMWNSYGTNPIISTSYRNKSHHNFLRWNRFLNEDSIHNFVHGSITTNANKFSLALGNELLNQFNGMSDAFCRMCFIGYFIPVE